MDKDIIEMTIKGALHLPHNITKTSKTITISKKYLSKIESSLYSRYYAEACNERRRSACATQRRSGGEPWATLRLIWPARESNQEVVYDV